jgi:hypothetical protein
LWFTLHTPTYAYKGKQRLVRELPKKWRRTEVSVPYSGSGSAIGWHNNTLKIDLMFVYADAISIRVLRVSALLAARGPLIEKRKSWKCESLCRKAG